MTNIFSGVTVLVKWAPYKLNHLPFFINRGKEGSKGGMVAWLGERRKKKFCIMVLDFVFFILVGNFCMCLRFWLSILNFMFHHMLILFSKI